MPSPRALTRAMLAFGGVLRASGLLVTTPELMDAVRALEVVDLMDRDEVYRALRTVLVSRMEEQPAFDRCFEAFWRFQAEEGQGLEGLVSMVQPTLPEHGGNPPEAGQEKQAQIALDDWEEGEEADDEPLEVPGLSNREVLMERDFLTFPAQHLHEVARPPLLVAKRLARRMS